MFIVPITIIGAIQFGKMCKMIILKSLAPIDLNAKMYSWFLTAKTLPRIILAKDGTDHILIAITTFVRLVPKIEIINKTKKKLRKENNNLIINIIIEFIFFNLSSI